MRVLGVVVALAGCPGGGDDACDEVDTDCVPLYAPRFAEVYSRTLVVSCASGGASCHAPEGAQGGFVVSDEASTYDALLGGAFPYVDPADPGCSTLLHRLESDDPGYVMPVGASLGDSEVCAVRQWIVDGAEP